MLLQVERGKSYKSLRKKNAEAKGSIGHLSDCEAASVAARQTHRAPVSLDNPQQRADPAASNMNGLQGLAFPHPQGSGAPSEWPQQPTHNNEFNNASYSSPLFFANGTPAYSQASSMSRTNSLQLPAPPTPTLYLHAASSPAAYYAQTATAIASVEASGPANPLAGQLACDRMDHNAASGGKGVQKERRDDDPEPVVFKWSKMKNGHWDLEAKVHLVNLTLAHTPRNSTATTNAERWRAVTEAVSRRNLDLHRHAEPDPVPSLTQFLQYVDGVVQKSVAGAEGFAKYKVAPDWCRTQVMGWHKSFEAFVENAQPSGTNPNAADPRGKAIWPQDTDQSLAKMNEVRALGPLSLSLVFVPCLRPPAHSRIFSQLVDFGSLVDAWKDSETRKHDARQVRQGHVCAAELVKADFVSSLRPFSTKRSTKSPPVCAPPIGHAEKRWGVWLRLPGAWEGR